MPDTVPIIALLQSFPVALSWATVNKIDTGIIIHIRILNILFIAFLSSEFITLNFLASSARIDEYVCFPIFVTLAYPSPATTKLPEYKLSFNFLLIESDSPVIIDSSISNPLL